MSVCIGKLQTRNRVFLAPMSGVSDEPFRVLAHACGAGLVVSEMVASEDLVKARPDMLKRTAGAGKISPLVIQLAGREAKWMAEGARMAQNLGADIIDINMGCPARQVTGGLSGSALMRDLDHAMTLIQATVSASAAPVTLKMRLGWDRQSINAPELARRAEAAGVQMITVHGRTRCQFYTGHADWPAIRAVKQAVDIPVIANGDAVTPADAETMLEASGADGIMIGRGSFGRPWWPGVIAEALEAGSGIAEPPISHQASLAREHHEAILSHYGHEHGNRIARKHLGWLILRAEQAGRICRQTAATWREALLQTTDNSTVAQRLRQFFLGLEAVEAEAA
jgi:nifR3 family TIM-barrel protein